MSHTQRSVVTGPAALDPRSRALLELQRQSLATSLREIQPEPSVGDVWVTQAAWPTGIAKGLAAMIVVLRAFTEAWSARTLYDVAPLSDDERLASEWSLLLGADVSGLGFPIVAHIDAQCSTTSSMLTRRLGALAEAALADLHLLLQAYASGDTAVLELAVGHTGRRSVRHHLEWEEFASALLAISQELTTPLLQSIDGAPNDAAISENEPSLLLVSEESPPPFAERWVFVEDPPSILDRARERETVVRLGHVITRYVQETPTHGFDREAFELLRVLLDLDYSELAELNHMQRLVRFKSTFGSGSPGSRVVALVSNSILHWSISEAKAGAGASLDRIAARKADPSRP